MSHTSTRQRELSITVLDGEPFKPALSPKSELVILVGYPSMGKSTLYRKYFGPAGYKHISQDVLGSRPKCIKATEEVLSSGKSCVIGMRCPWRCPNLAINHIFT